MKNCFYSFVAIITLCMSQATPAFAIDQTASLSLSTQGLSHDTVSIAESKTTDAFQFNHNELRITANGSASTSMTYNSIKTHIVSLSIVRPHMNALGGVDFHWALNFDASCAPLNFQPTDSSTAYQSSKQPTDINTDHIHWTLTVKQLSNDADPIVSCKIER